ncbi:hypothetical protein IMSHALPRED_004100 [Imshaugia aleurites]|uniref:Uncharacterized protein n=1 Tax=Imshaugia aleurites TaxID=172621 RepID=A0A8H3IAA7_9LECA|nr:hypothetical protein IMSHALPRED_004100 [Imshaugia aleurites]
MACNRSSAAGDVCISSTAVDTGENGRVSVDTCQNPLALLGYQDLGSINTAHSKINGTFPFNKFPVELQNKIIGYAMVATDAEFRFTCFTNRPFTPNVTVGLLLVNHGIYHEAHYQLRKQNTFVFDHYGADLNAIASSIGPLRCRTGACGHAPLRSSLAKAVFDLGDEDLPGYGNDQVYAFGCALRHLRSGIVINSLHLNLAYHTFGNSAQLSSFASALSKIKVQDKVTITGDEKFLDMCLGDIPITLGMHMLPMHSKFQAYRRDMQYSPGWFLYQYVPERRVGKDPEHFLKSFFVNLAYLAEVERRVEAKIAG